MEFESQGELYGLSPRKVCAIADPEGCGSIEKSREYLPGYKHQAPPGAPGKECSVIPWMPAGPEDVSCVMHTARHIDWKLLRLQAGPV